MRIVVTGSSGLIGSELVAHLRAGGHDVVRLVRSEATGVDEVAWAPADGKIDASGLEGTDAVIHLAGAGIADKRWSARRKQEILESRTRSTDLLSRTLAELDKPPSVLVSGSAVGYYGDRGDEKLSEESDGGTGFLAEVCRQWEAAADPARAAGIRVVHARSGIVLSADGGALAKQLPLFKFGAGGRIGSGRQWWSWISMADEVGALEWLLEGDLSGPVNLTGPEPVTNADFTQSLGRVLGRPTLLPVPRFGPKLLLGGELAEALLFASQRVLPVRLENSGYVFAHRTVTEAFSAVLT